MDTTKLLGTLYMKPYHPLGDVTIFGKSPRKTAKDKAEGIARLGGPMMQPSYLFAYLRSADVLVRHGMQEGTLDDIGLPAFYMQRHVMELLLKRFLEYLYDYAQAKGNMESPTATQIEKLTTSHNLESLLNDLVEVCEHHKFTTPSQEFSELVKLFKKFEINETWSRYSSSSRKGKKLPHQEKEKRVPIVEIQHRLQNLVTTVVYTGMNSDAYESEFYHAWAEAKGLHHHEQMPFT